MDLWEGKPAVNLGRVLTHMRAQSISTAAWMTPLLFLLSAFTTFIPRRSRNLSQQTPSTEQNVTLIIIKITHHLKFPQWHGVSYMYKIPPLECTSLTISSLPGNLFSVNERAKN